jgi:hypothetical protein
LAFFLLEGSQVSEGNMSSKVQLHTGSSYTQLDKGALDYSELPLVESARYKNIEFNSKSAIYKEFYDSLNKNGFCILDLGLSENLIDQANNDIKNAIDSNTIKLNSKAYHYNESPRIVEAWKFSNAIMDISTNDSLLRFLKFAYESDPIPFSTINFVKGTEQPLHSDEFHFGTIPHRFLTGCWIALEDIDPNSGPLSLVVGSHRLPLFSFEKLGIGIPRNEAEFKKSYTLYEDWVRETVEKEKLEIVTPILKKGQCLIWLSNTLHGSYQIRDKSLTRKSLVVHFHYERCKKVFYPSYSNLETGKLVKRPLAGLDIRRQIPQSGEPI